MSTQRAIYMVFASLVCVLGFSLFSYGATAKTVVGTGANECINGTDQIDDLNGMGGNDFIHGYALPDLLDGGNGRDAIYGGDGNDVISGGAGDDMQYATTCGGYTAGLWGGSGNDTIYGNDGRDQIWGGPGVDELRGNDGDDYIFADGDLGNSETVYGGPGDGDYCQLDRNWDVPYGCETVAWMN